MGPCFEFPIPRAEFTPEKGHEQLARMRACYAREWQKRMIMLLIMLGAFLVMVLFIGLAVVVRQLAG